MSSTAYRKSPVVTSGGGADILGPADRCGRTRAQVDLPGRHAVLHTASSAAWATYFCR
ncbi:hypothetical protein L083_1780 [Actinoplanes sp. N902-109]|nr:hypothetical protein L083_1780 [Actinoplanes sp. N902-109]